MAGRCNCLHAVSDLPHANNCPAWEPDTGPSLRDALYPKRTGIDTRALRERLDGWDAAMRPNVPKGGEVPYISDVDTLRTLLDVYEAAEAARVSYSTESLSEYDRKRDALHRALKEGQGR